MVRHLYASIIRQDLIAAFSAIIQSDFPAAIWRVRKVLQALERVRTSGEQPTVQVGIPIYEYEEETNAETPSELVAELLGDLRADEQGNPPPRECARRLLMATYALVAAGDFRAANENAAEALRILEKTVVEPENPTLIDIMNFDTRKARALANLERAIADAASTLSQRAESLANATEDEAFGFELEYDEYVGIVFNSPVARIVLCAVREVVKLNADEARNYAVTLQVESIAAHQRADSAESLADEMETGVRNLKALQTEVNNRVKEVRDRADETRTPRDVGQIPF